MTFVWTLLAIVSPLTAGITLVERLRDRETNIAWILGTGWLLGQIMTMAALYLMLTVTGTSHARWIIVAMFLIAALFVLKKRGSASTQENLTTLSTGLLEPSSSPRFGWRHLLFAAILVSLTVKLCILLAAHLWIPVRADDAISLWLFKAKTIAGLDALSRDPSSPHYLGGSNPHYPVFLPLLSAWIPLVSGHWNEYTATWPWLGFYISLPLAIAGGLRRWLNGISAWTTAYITASLPLLVIHAYRPGYADITTAVFLAVAVISFLTWRSTARFAHLLLAMTFLFATAVLKREGPPIAAVVFLAMIVPSWTTLQRMTKNQCAWFIGMTIVAAILVLSVVGISDVNENAEKLHYYPDVWQALVRHLLSWSSFQFLFWLVPAILLTVALRKNGTHQVPALLLFVGLFLLDAAIFVLTPQARFALNDQTPSRIFLQAAPAWIAALSIPLNTAGSKSN